MKRFLPICLLVAISCGTEPAADETNVQAAPPVLRTPKEAWDLVGLLAGEWKNALDTGNMRSYEQWSVLDSNTYSGLGFVLSGADTVSIEDLRITRTAPSIAYAARISTQNNGDWVEFQLQATGRDTLLFTNPAHDFPTAIRYVHAVSNVWDVLVSGGGKSFALRYERRPSE